MKKKKRVGLATKIFIAAFTLYAAVTLVTLQLQINAKNQEQTSLNAQLEDQLVKNAELQAIVDGENKDEYIADAARDRLDYATPGEKVFVDISSK